MTRYHSQNLPYKENFPYGSMFHYMGDDGFFYSRETLSKWTIRELLLKHYYLTMRLDGYGHLDASEYQKANCLTFRAELESRGVDAVRNVMDNEKWYDWGYRSVQTKWFPLGAPREEEGCLYVRIGL